MNLRKNFFLTIILNLSVISIMTLASGAVYTAEAQVKKIVGAVQKPTQLQKINPPQKAVTTQTINKQAVMAAIDVKEEISSVKFIGIKGNEMTLRINYRVSAQRKHPIYAGAFLYSDDHQAINAGYKPAQISTSGKDGYIDIVLVLPEEPFESAYVESFLTQPQDPLFTKGYFTLKHSWKGTTSTAKMEEIKVMPVNLSNIGVENHQDFCEIYAERALEQYHTAKENNLPDIVPPVWNSDGEAHFEWCLSVDRQQAINGDALRQSHIDNSLNN
jgi:hypothetical protein